MSVEDLHKKRKTDRTLIAIIMAIILVAVLNAGVSVALAINTQDRYNNAVKQQQTSTSIIFGHICQTLESLHADAPPAGNQPARAFLQDLHNRLGELATDLKC